jgi:hypothetical protein
MTDHRQCAQEPADGAVTDISRDKPLEQRPLIAQDLVFDIQQRQTLRQ